MKTIYVVEYRYDSPGISSALVERETEKFYIIKRDSIEKVLGSFVYISSRVSKDRHEVFLSMKDVFEYIRKCATEKIQKHQNHIDKAQAVLDDLENKDED